MKKIESKARSRYSSEFKSQAIELAKEIGIVEAANKLGIKTYQTLSSWVRHSHKMDVDTEFQELEKLRSEVKRLKRELDIEKKSVAILKDATAFFCQDLLK